MTKGKPRDDKQQILALARAGIPPAEIARRIGTISRGTVRVLLCQARSTDPTIPRFAPGANIRAVPANALPSDAAVRFEAEAERRGQSADQLIAAVLTAVADDNLFAAVLDE